MDFSVFLGFDRMVFEWVEKVFSYGISGILTLVLTFFTTIGDKSIIWLVLGVALLPFKKTRKIGLVVLASQACTLFINNLFLKNFFARPRPFDLDVWKDWFLYPEFIRRPDSFSFPSGHSSSSFAAATALIYSKKKRFIIPGFIVAAIIAFSRIYMHVHYPTDVLFGALLGILYGVIAIFACKLLFKIINEKTKLTVLRD